MHTSGRMHGPRADAVPLAAPLQQSAGQVSVGRCEVCVRAKKGKCGTAAAIYACLNRPGGPVAPNGVRRAGGSDEIATSSPARLLGSGGADLGFKGKRFRQRV